MHRNKPNITYLLTFKKMNLKMSSAECGPSCLSLNVLKGLLLYLHSIHALIEWRYSNRPFKIVHYEP